MKYLFTLTFCLIGGLAFAHPKPAPHPHPVPHHNPGHFNKGPVKPINHGHAHFNQAGVEKNKFGYSYKGYNWGFWKGHKFLGQYKCWGNWNPYTHCWYYWNQPAGYWYPVSYCPTGVYSFEDSPAPDTCEVEPNDVDE